MTIPADKEIGRIIRHRRWMIGMTQQQLARRIGASVENVREFESGARPIGSAAKSRIADSIDLPLTALRSGGGGQMEAIVLSHDEAAALMRSYFGLGATQILTAS